MKKKKIILIVSISLAATLLVAGIITALVFLLRKDEEPVVEEPTSAYQVTLQNETLMLTIGDESALLAEFTKIEGQELVFSSSDETVVTVDEYGRLQALREGTATITVTYGEASDTCVITVSLGELLPLLQMPNVPANEFSIYKSSQVELNGIVLFNDKTYGDVELKYEVSNTEVGKVENGVFQPLQVGTTEVYVTGTWRGSSAASLTKRFTVNVIPELSLKINEGINSITLRTQDAKVSPFVVRAELDGTWLDTQVEVTSGSEYVKYDETKEQVVSRGLIGEAEITVSYTVEGEVWEQKIPVYVEPTMYRYEQTVTNFSAIHGDAATGRTLRSILGSDIVSAYDKNGNALEIKDNKIFGIESSKTGKFTTEITLYSTTRGLTVALEGYTGVFSKAEDLAVFNTNVRYTSANGFEAVDKTKPMQVWDGYYVLANNIDATKYTHASSGSTLNSRGIQSGYPYGLFGTFDGQGYTIKGITMRQFGLFGYVNGATIKDVAFVDVNLDSSVNYSTTLAQWINESTVSNVYVNIANDGTYGARAALFAGGVNASKLKGCIVETKETFAFKDSLSVYGSFTYLNLERARKDSIQSSFEEVYVLSKPVLGYYESTSVYLQAANETLDKDGLKAKLLAKLVQSDLNTEVKKAVNAKKAEIAARVAAEVAAMEGLTDEEKAAKTTELTTQYTNEVTAQLTAELTEALTKKYTAELDEDFKILTLQGLRKYDNAAAMQADGNATYAAFNECWDLTGGAPVWKSMNGEYPSADEIISDAIPDNIVVGKFDVNWL